jgi:uncharacterized protein involved in exopolysaccharide biosynthesis
MNQDKISAPELTIAELMHEVVRSWRLILGASLAFACVGLGIGLLRAPRYQASALLLPVSDQSGGQGSLAALASRYAGLAALAGVSLGGSGNAEEAIAVLKSQQIATLYIDSEGLLPSLFERKWDKQAGQWKPGKPPTLWKGVEKFRKSVMFVSHDAKTGLVRVSITWTDPLLAAEWANGIVRLTNMYLREKALSESERNISYLSEEAQKASLIDARQAIFDVMRDEINRQMMARGRDEFALRVLDPAVAPERPSSPGPRLLLVIFGLLGAFVSVVIILGRRVLRADGGA